MKHCPYCKTDYEPGAAKCPSCAAADAETKCDGCGAVFRTKFCPECGLRADETPGPRSKCVKCGEIIRERICPRCGYDILTIDDGKDCKEDGCKWVGCRCVRCGITVLNGEHAFRPEPGKCEDKCVVCGEVQKVLHTWRGGKCVRCGVARSFFNTGLFGWWRTASYSTRGYVIGFSLLLGGPILGMLLLKLFL